MNKEFYKNARVIYILEGLVLSHIVTGLILLLFHFNVKLVPLLVELLIWLILYQLIGGFLLKRAEQKKVYKGLLVSVLFCCSYAIITNDE